MNRSIHLLAALPLLAAAARGQSLPEIPVPPGNPLTPSKVALGKALFWDEQLSSTGTVACGTCHRPASGGSDPRTARHPGADALFGTDDDVFGSPGIARTGEGGVELVDILFGRHVQVTGRRPRTVINAALWFELFWDGRAEETFLDPLTGEEVLAWGGALERQAIEPILNVAEMAHEGRSWEDVVARLDSVRPLARSPEVPRALEQWIGGRGYGALFDEAFGDEAITPARIAMAIASYERTLVADRAPLFLNGADGFEWTELEREGLELYQVLACNTCHPLAGGLLTDQAYHYLGVQPLSAEQGLAGLTGLRQDRGRVLTPTILNASLRAPYFHDGSKATLEEVIEFYDRGGDFGRREIGPLNLDEREKASLVAFLKRPLTDPRLAREEQPFDRPKLASEVEPVQPVAAAGLLTALPPAFPRAESLLWTRGNTALFPFRSSRGPGPLGVGEELPVDILVPDRAVIAGLTLPARWRALDVGPRARVDLSIAVQVQPPER